MRCLLVPGVIFVVAAAAPCAIAANVYRCAGADGSLAFQDRPCARGEQQSLVPLPEVATPAPPPVAAVAPAIDTAPVVAPPAAVTRPPRPPAPEFFLCRRYDGSWYRSEDGIGGNQLVPFGMVAGSGQSLAEAYGGRNGIGVSAPGLREPPVLKPGQAPLAGAYVRVYDECHHAAPAEACAFLRDRLDTIEDRLRRAFSDTETQLRQEQAQLREQMTGC